MTVRCYFCDRQVDPQARETYRRAVGWERKAIADSRRGGSDIVLRELLEVFACPVCITRQQQGLAPLQESLLG